MKSIAEFASRPLVRYALVGGLAYLVEMAALLTAIRLGASGIVAVGTSFWVGLLFSFFAQKLVTFQNRERSTKALGLQAAGYAALVVFNYLFTLAFVWLFMPLASVFVLRTVCIGLITGWNFFVYRWLFRSRPAGS